MSAFGTFVRSIISDRIMKFFLILLTVSIALAGSKAQKAQENISLTEGVLGFFIIILTVAFAVSFWTKVKSTYCVQCCVR